MIVTQEPIIKRCKCFAKIKVIQRCAKLKGISWLKDACYRSAKLKGSPWLKDVCYTRTKHLVKGSSSKNQIR